MSLPIRLLPEARTEFDDATDWYERQRTGMGVAFVGRVRDVFQRVAANPRIHATVLTSPGERRTHRVEFP